MLGGVEWTCEFLALVTSSINCQMDYKVLKISHFKIKNVHVTCRDKLLCIKRVTVILFVFKFIGVACERVSKLFSPFSELSLALLFNIRKGQLKKFKSATSFISPFLIKARLLIRNKSSLKTIGWPIDAIFVVTVLKFNYTF